MNKKQKSAIYEKIGMAFVIAEIKDKFKVKHIFFEGYENDKDRVSFQFDGHQCRLLAIHRIDWREQGIIELEIMYKGGEAKDWQIDNFFMKIQHLRFSTLERMAVEAYAHLGEEAEAEEFIKDTYGNFLDTYPYMEIF